MGYSMSVYRVDLDAMRKRIAQKDQTLLEALKKTYAQKLKDQVTDIEETDFEAEEELGGCLGFLMKRAGKTHAKPTHPQPTEEPTPELLLRHIVFGEPKFHGGWSPYGYQLMWVVEHLGTEMDCEAFESMRSSSGWTETVSKALIAAGMPAATFDFQKMLIDRGAPIPLPPMTDFPFMGYLEAGEVKAAREAFGKVDVAKAIQATGEADYGKLAMRNIESWLTDAAAANEGVVAFYY
jgi:hypothetical protein